MLKVNNTDTLAIWTINTLTTWTKFLIFSKWAIKTEICSDFAIKTIQQSVRYFPSQQKNTCN